jgi:peptidoglycan/xylan/chitin deacetylase (PgdA/CDA1 family)
VTDRGALPRRLVLAAGAALLLPGCSAAPVGQSASSASATPTPSDTYRLPEVLPTAGLPVVARPIPGVCPTTGPTPSGRGPQHYLVCTGTQIALTLDDGPSPEWTARMLRLLESYRVKATFSMIGRAVAAHPGLVDEVVAAGHLVGNHTYTHPDLSRLTRAAVEREIHSAGDAIEKACGRRPALFRAPGGHWSPAVLAVCAAAGMRPLDWSVDPRDWSQPGTRKIAEVILQNTRPGSIILEHDGGGDRHQTYEALSIAIPRLLDAGYRFVQP